MKNLFLLFIVTILFSLNLSAQHLDGIYINEILPDPGNTFDMDGDGTVEPTDEFVELYNSTAAPVDVSGWEVYNTLFQTYVIPNGTVIPAYGFFTMVTNYDPNTPPAMTHSMGHAVGVYGDQSTPILGGGSVILYDRVNDRFIQAAYGNFVPLTVISVANLVGSIFADDEGSENFGTANSGESMQRMPSGSSNFQGTTPTPASDNTAPLAIGFFNFEVESKGDATELSWMTDDLPETYDFLLERSTDGDDWFEIGYYTSADAFYQVEDISGEKGQVFYRLSLVSLDGKIAQEETRSIFIETEMSVAVFPNPSVDYVTVRADEKMQDKWYSVRMISATGQLMDLQLSEEMQEVRFERNGLSAGMYFLVMMNEQGEVLTSEKVIFR